ncbi:MAG: DUF2231 domain-containing protein [Gallionellaceae bacterium]|nr:MAG: DUF2231 domain-containing protein [Gallionellaceae bacterium]
MIEVIPNWHPLFVHFPVALISLSAFFHLAAILLRKLPRWAAHCAVLAHSTLWLGALAALPTALFGWLASNTVNHDEVGHAAMLLHRSWALATLLALTVLAGWDAWTHKADGRPTWPVAGAVILAWALVASTAWHGAELVYRHGLGVMSMPKSEGPGHTHEHGEDHGEMPVQGAAVPHEDGHTHSHEGTANGAEAGHTHAPGTPPHKD